METVVSVGMFLLSIGFCGFIVDIISDAIDARQAKKNINKN